MNQREVNGYLTKCRIMYISVKEIAEKWNISDRRVGVLCSEGKIPGVNREVRRWKITETTKKLEKGRIP